MTTTADLAIADLARGEAELRETVASYRLALSVALGLLHEEALQRGREREVHLRLVEEYRAFRARVMMASPHGRAA